MREDRSGDGTGEPCPFLDYCGSTPGLSNLGICRGMNGDYNDCTVYRHYLEQDARRHSPPLKGLERKV